MTLEIDDRYPEFAAPYAPEDRGKHRRGLTWGGLATVALVLIFATVLLRPVPAPEDLPEQPETPPDEPVVTQYTVTFVDWDGTIITSASYDEGTAAGDISVPADPTRANDDSYRYTFDGWMPALADVTGDAVYTATYVATALQYYSVTFVDYDGTTVLQAATYYVEGTAASDIVQPATPTRAPDGTYAYTFSGWTPALTDVTGDVIYTAVYDSEKNKYTITWLNYDGSTIDTTMVEQDETPVHADPTYGPTDQYTYIFIVWSPTIVPATADATYTAMYLLEERPYYDITFVDEDGVTVLQATTSYVEGTRASDIVQPDVPTTFDGEVYHEFAGWNPALADVTGDMTYVATYNNVPAVWHYVTFVDWDGTVILDETGYVEGTPASDITVPADPTRADTVVYTYAFAGWSPDLAEVTADVTYTATYTQTPIPYEGSTIELVPQIETDGTGDWPGAIFTANVALNDVAGSVGHLRLLHYNYGTKEWDEVPFYNEGDGGWWEDAYVDLYAKTSEDDAGTLLSPSDKNALYDIPEDAEILEAEINWLIPLYDDEGGWLEGHRTRDIMRLVFDYELPNGETGTAKLPDDIFYVYYGWFFEGHNDWEVDLSKKTLTLTIPYQVDRGGPLDYDSIYWHPHLYDDATGEDLKMTPTITNYTEADGTVVAKIEYTFDTFVPGRAYRFNADAIYSDYGDEEHWNNWLSYTDLWGIEFPVPEYVAPDISSISNVDYSGSFAADYTAHFLPTATINDVAGSTGRLKLLRENPSTGTFEEQALGGSNDADATDFEYYDGTEWKALDTPSNLNAEYAIPEDAERIRASMSWSMDYPSARNVRDKMKVAFDYTLPDGTKGTVISEDYFYLYKGGFVDSNTDPVLDRKDKTITMDFTYYLDEGGDIDPDKVEWSDHRLSWKLKSETSSGYGTEIEGITPEISEYDEDGVHHVVVKYTLDEISDDYYYFYQAKVLDNEWGDSDHWNNWETDALHVYMSFPEATTYEPPKIDLVHDLNYYESWDEYFVDFTVKVDLNDVAGNTGQLKLRHYDAQGGTWEWVPLTDNADDVFDSYVSYIQLYSTKDGERTALKPSGGYNTLYEIPEDAEGLEADITWRFPWYENPEDEYDILMKIREVMSISFDYTLPDGTEDTIALAENFYLYNDWFFGWPDDPVLDATAKTITFYYPYDVEYGGPLNYDNIYWHPHLYWKPASNYQYGETGTELDMEPEITQVVEDDGTVAAKIVYTFDTIVPGRAYDFKAEVIYSDYGVDDPDFWNNWVVHDSEYRMEFDTGRPPVVSIDEDSYFNDRLDGTVPASGFTVDVDLKDAAEQTVQLHIMRKDHETGEWLETPLGDDSYVWVYFGYWASDPDTGDVHREYFDVDDLTQPFQLPEDIYGIFADVTWFYDYYPDDVYTARDTLKVGFDYTLEKGFEGTAWSEEFFVYKNYFREEYNPVLDPYAKTITMEVGYLPLDAGGPFNPDYVYWPEYHLSVQDGGELEITPTFESITLPDGLPGMRITYDLSDEEINGKSFTFKAYPVYSEYGTSSHWNVWRDEVWYDNMVFPEATYTAPTIADITGATYDYGSAGNAIFFEPVVTLNDVAGYTGRLKLLHENPDKPGTWTEEPLASDTSMGARAVDFKYNDGSNWVSMETPSNLNAKYSIPAAAMQLRANMTRWLIPTGNESIREKAQVAFDYTLPDGTESTVESNEFFLYRGSFAKLSGTPELNRADKTITMDFVYRLDVGGEIDPDNVTWQAHHLYWKEKDDDSDGPGTEITDVAEPQVVHSDVDGVHHVTVTYTLGIINDDWMYTYVGDVLDDEWGDSTHWNNWKANANSYYMEFPEGTSTHTSPMALEPGPGVSHSYGGDSEDYHVGFMMMSRNLNDAEGGKIALRIERYDEGSGWVSPEGGFISYDAWQENEGKEYPDKQLIYDAQTIWSVTMGTANTDDPIEPSDPTTLDIDNPTQLFDVGDHSAVYAIFMYHFPDEYWYGMRVTLRTAMDVVYADGTTETIYSTPFYVYGGSFIEPNNDFGSYGVTIDKANKTFSLEYYYDSSAVEIVPSDVRWVSDADEMANCNYLYYAVNYAGWWPASRDSDWEQLELLDIKPTASERDESGKHYVTLTFDLSDAPEELWADPYRTYLFYMGTAWYQDHTGDYFGAWETHPDHGYISVSQFVD